jgi:hypothetical protein
MRFTNLDFATNRGEFGEIIRRLGKQRAHRQQQCHRYANQEIPLHRVENTFSCYPARARKNISR